MSERGFENVIATLETGSPPQSAATLHFRAARVSLNPYRIDYKESRSAFVLLAREHKTNIITQYRSHAKDTGSPEVQIALLSERIRA